MSTRTRSGLLDRHTRERLARWLCVCLLSATPIAGLSAERSAEAAPTAPSAPSAPAAATSAPDPAASPAAPRPASPGSQDTGKEAAAPKADAAAASKALAALEFRPGKPLDFGQTLLGDTSPASTVTLVAGSGASAVERYSIRARGDFKVTPDSCELAAKGACAVSVTFAPTRPGAATGAILVAESHGGPTRVAAELQGQGEAALVPVFLVCAVFLAGMLLVRWHMVAVPAREQLRAEIDTVATRLPDSPPPTAAGDAMVKAVHRLVVDARHRLDPGKSLLDRLNNVVFWSRGFEHMGFQLLHEAKHLLVAESAPDALRVELEVAERRLRAQDEPDALALANSIRAELDKTPVDVTDAAGAVLRETLDCLKRTAGEALADVAAAVAPRSAVALPELVALARRVEAALSAGQQSALALAVEAALRAPDGTLPAEHRSLLGHTRDVLLPLAEEARAALQTAGAAQPALDAAQWREALAAFSRHYIGPAEALRVRIEAALGAVVAPPPERWRALAREANHQLYEAEDVEFAWTASWHKKTLWLAFLGLMLICALSATLHNATLFLLGALGGLLSRMQRMLTRDKVAVDYGQSWVTLFLSPVVGALAGWSGVLLVAVAVEWGVLGNLFGKVLWDQPQQVLTMGLALLFGISERLLTSVVTSLEGKANAGSPEARAATGKAAAAAKGLEITTSGTLPPCKVGSEVSQKFKAEGGAAPLSWTLARGPLPKGLSLDDKGELKGKPQEVTSTTFTLAVSDSAGAHQEREFTLQVTK